MFDISLSSGASILLSLFCLLFAISKELGLMDAAVIFQRIFLQVRIHEFFKAGELSWDKDT